MILLADIRYMGDTANGRIHVEKVSLVEPGDIERELKTLVREKYKNGCIARTAQVKTAGNELERIEWCSQSGRGVITARDLGKMRI